MPFPSVIADPGRANARVVLVPTTLETGEWWSAHVLRALHRNGLQVDREYLIRQLQPRLAALYPQEVVNRHRAGERCESGAVAFAGMELPHWAVRGLSSNVQVCHQCLQQAPFLRIGWQLRSIGLCAKHMVRLAHRCPRCQSRWKLWDAVSGRCQCGFVLADSQFEVPVRCVEEAWAQAGYAEGGGDLGKPYREQVACEVLLTRLLRKLAAKPVMGAEQYRLPNGEADHIAWAEAAGVLLPPCADNVTKLWPKLQSVAHLDLALSVVCRVAHEELKAPTALSCLPFLQWALELADLGANPNRAVAAGWVKPGQLTAGRVSMKRAARMAGVRPMHVRFLVNKGMLSPVTEFRQGNRQLVFTLEQVETLKTLRPSAFTSGSSLVAGLDGRARHVLRLSRALSMRKDVHGIQRLDASALDGLLRSLELNAVDAPHEANSLVGLGTKTVWRHRFLAALPSVLRDLGTGRFPVYRNAGYVGLNAFAVGTDVLVELRRRSVARSISESMCDVQQSIAGLEPVAREQVPTVRPSIADGRSPTMRRRVRSLAGQLSLLEVA